MTVVRREHRGAARDARLTVLLGDSTGNLTITCDDLTGWPTGSVGPFFAVLDESTSSEEKVLCVSRSGNVLTVYSSGFNGRAQDNTVISEHAVNATIAHCITAQEMDEANAHIMATSDVHGASGAIVGQDTLDVAVAAINLAKASLSGAAFTGEVDVVSATADDSTSTRQITISTSTPSGGADGDLWVTHTA